MDGLIRFYKLGVESLEVRLLPSSPNLPAVTTYLIPGTVAATRALVDDSSNRVATGANGSSTSQIESGFDSDEDDDSIPLSPIQPSTASIHTAQNVALVSQPGIDPDDFSKQIGTGSQLPAPLEIQTDPDFDSSNALVHAVELGLVKDAVSPAAIEARLALDVEVALPSVPPVSLQSNSIPSTQLSTDCDFLPSTRVYSGLNSNAIERDSTSMFAHSQPPGGLPSISLELFHDRENAFDAAISKGMALSRGLSVKVSNLEAELGGFFEHIVSLAPGDAASPSCSLSLWLAAAVLLAAGTSDAIWIARRRQRASGVSLDASKVEVEEIHATERGN